jgi:maleate isomerase
MTSPRIAAGTAPRARVGVVVPADNVIAEPELHGLGLTDVSFHFTRLPNEDRERMRDDALVAAGALRIAGVDALVYACSETSALGDADSMSFVGRLGEAAAAPAISATAALVELLQATGASRIVLATPYRPGYGELVENVYHERGIEVVAALHRHFPPPAGDEREWFATNRRTPADVRALAREAFDGDADALVLPATNLPTLDLLAALAAELRVPVVAGNQALAWWSLGELEHPGQEALLSMGQVAA